MKTTKTKNGFTMVEVALVLGIAGLIFAMVFIALPNLWASERDGERRENMMTFITNLKNFQTNNNRGALPGSTSSSGSDRDKLERGEVIEVSGEEVHNSALNGSYPDTSWAGFYRDYFNDTFKDPGGYWYDLYVTNCQKKDSTLSLGANCNNDKFERELVGINNINNGGSDNVDHVIHVAVGATCDGDTAVKSANSRKVAVVYKLERAGQYCYGS